MIDTILSPDFSLHIHNFKVKTMADIYAIKKFIIN